MGLAEPEQEFREWFAELAERGRAKGIWIERITESEMRRFHTKPLKF